MKRRHFIRSVTLAPLAKALLGSSVVQARPQAAPAHTVLGPRAPEQLGVTLMHEHILVDFIGAGQVSRSRYDPAEALGVALPYLRRIHERGCRTLVECTPAYLGRDPGLLRKLSEASGLNLITNTGYYGAAADRFVPPHAYAESADQLAKRWTREFREGIEETGIKPGIMKIGVDKGDLSPIDAKLVRAAARTHLQTGLTIASHTGDGAAALAELELLRKEGVSASAFIWVHAQNETQLEKHFEAARRGAWVEFDGISEESQERHLRLVRGMIEHGFLHRTLISQDAGWYRVGEPGGGSFRSFEHLFTHFLPALKTAGITDPQIRALMVENPRSALTPAARTPA